MLLDKLCAELGGVFEDACDVVVAWGLEEVIDYINNNYGPEQVCVLIGMCDSAGQEDVVCFVKGFQVFNFFKGGIVFCEACEVVL